MNKQILNKEYLNYNEKKIKIRKSSLINKLYNLGYVFGRSELNKLFQVRSLRINLSTFSLNSENRRILRKFPNTELLCIDIPLEISDYDWKIHKLGSDFYKTKFGEGIFSANKIKELVTTKHNFNLLLKFTEKEITKGYVICYRNIKNNFIHYAYPFYEIKDINTNLGIYMMTKLISVAKENHYRYVYLGSVHDPSSKYKLQFEGAEWWDYENETWSNDLVRVKSLISDNL